MEDIEVIYIGRRQTTSGKVAHAMILPSQIDAIKAGSSPTSPFVSDISDKIDRKASLFQFKRGPSSIGSVYRFKGEIEDERLVRVSGDPQWVRAQPEYAEFVAAWKSYDDAVRNNAASKSAEKKADADPELTRAIAVIRHRLSRIPAGYRRGFQLWLLEQIEKRG